MNRKIKGNIVKQVRTRDETELKVLDLTYYYYRLQIVDNKYLFRSME